MALPAEIGTKAGRIPDFFVVGHSKSGETVRSLAPVHRQFFKVNVESEADFAKALALEEDRREGRRMPVNTFWPKALFYSDHVRYVEQLDRFEKHFPREQILVLIYDDY